MVSGGIFGPKLSGKTTLANALSREYWAKQKMRTMALDPHLEIHGEHAYVTSNEQEFWKKVWECQNALVIVEEAASTIRRERTLIPVFTRLRHCNHKLLIVGHSGTDLLPVMRQQFDTLYLFRQPEESSIIWSKVFCQKELLQAQELQQYEFLYTKLYGTPKKLRLKI